MTIEKKSDQVSISAKEAKILVSKSSLSIGDLLIDSAGEYESKGVFVEALTGSTFILGLEGIKMVISEQAKPKQIEAMGSVDLLITTKKNLIRSISPRAVVRLDKLKKLAVKPSDLPSQGTKILNKV